MEKEQKKGETYSDIDELELLYTTNLKFYEQVELVKETANVYNIYCFHKINRNIWSFTTQNIANSSQAYISNVTLISLHFVSQNRK